MTTFIIPVMDSYAILQWTGQTMVANETKHMNSIRDIMVNITHCLFAKSYNATDYRRQETLEKGERH